MPLSLFMRADRWSDTLAVACDRAERRQPLLGDSDRFLLPPCPPLSSRAVACACACTQQYDTSTCAGGCSRRRAALRRVRPSPQRRYQRCRALMGRRVARHAAGLACVATAPLPFPERAASGSGGTVGLSPAGGVSFTSVPSLLPRHFDRTVARVPRLAARAQLAPAGLTARPPPIYHRRVSVREWL